MPLYSVRIPTDDGDSPQFVTHGSLTQNFKTACNRAQKRRGKVFEVTGGADTKVVANYWAPVLISAAIPTTSPFKDGSRQRQFQRRSDRVEWAYRQLFG